MSQPVDGAALQEASAVLHRLAAHVEDGALVDEDGAATVVAAAWRGASEALAQAAGAGTS